MPVDIILFFPRGVWSFMGVKLFKGVSARKGRDTRLRGRQAPKKRLLLELLRGHNEPNERMAIRTEVST